MLVPPPRSTPMNTLFPCTTLFRARARLWCRRHEPASASHRLAELDHVVRQKLRRLCHPYRASPRGISDRLPDWADGETTTSCRITVGRGAALDPQRGIEIARRSTSS